jgi:hypothetical protein
MRLLAEKDPAKYVDLCIKLSLRKTTQEQKTTQERKTAALQEKVLRLRRTLQAALWLLENENNLDESVVRAVRRWLRSHPQGKETGEEIERLLQIVQAMQSSGSHKAEGLERCPADASQTTGVKGAGHAQIAEVGPSIVEGQHKPPDALAGPEGSNKSPVQANEKPVEGRPPTYAVRLERLDDSENELPLMREVEHALRCEWHEAVHLVTTAPRTVAEGISRERALTIAKHLQGYGARVIVTKE